TWRGTIERANKRATDLSNQLRDLQKASDTRLKEISHLQAMIGRLRDQNLDLDRRIDELTGENEALRVADNTKAQQIKSTVRANNRLRNDFFWTICQFVAGADRFERFANSVNYDLGRLFSLLLAAEIGEAANLSVDVKQHAAAVAGIFDPFFYLAQYPEVGLEGVNSLLHYMMDGSGGGRMPTRVFDTAYYAQKAKLGSGDALLHYVQKGAHAGLKPHPLFDGRYYSRLYPDVAKQNINPLFHYQTWGGR